MFKSRGYAMRACNCFVAGTPVATPGGLVAIETIQEGDEVLTRSPDRPGETSKVGRVTRVSRNLAPAILWLTLSTGDVMGTTPGHEVWTFQTGWTFASELHTGDMFMGIDGQAVSIVDIRLDPTPDAGLQFRGRWHLHVLRAGRCGVHNNSCDFIRQGKINNAVGHSFEVAIMEMMGLRKYTGPKLRANGTNFVPDFLERWNNWRHQEFGVRVLDTPTLRRWESMRNKTDLRAILYVAKDASREVKKYFTVITVP